MIDHKRKVFCISAATEKIGDAVENYKTVDQFVKNKIGKGFVSTSSEKLNKKDRNIFNKTKLSTEKNKIDSFSIEVTEIEKCQCRFCGKNEQKNAGQDESKNEKIGALIEKLSIDN